MTFNTTLPEPHFDPLFRIANFDLLVWSVISYLESFYVTVSLHKKRLSGQVVATLYSMATFLLLAYFGYSGALTWTLAMNLLAGLVMVHAILFTDDRMYLLAMVTITKYSLKPFSYIVDVLALLFIGVDIPRLWFENPTWWKALYILNLMASAKIADVNSSGPELYKYFLNGIFFCFFFLLCWNATERIRSIPVFIAVVIYMLTQLNMKELMSFSSFFESLARLPTIFQFDIFRYFK